MDLQGPLQSFGPSGHIWSSPERPRSRKSLTCIPCLARVDVLFLVSEERVEKDKLKGYPLSMKGSGIFTRDDMEGIFIKTTCNLFCCFLVWPWVGPCCNVDIIWVFPLDQVTSGKLLTCWSLLMLLLASGRVAGFQWNAFWTSVFCLLGQNVNRPQLNQSILITREYLSHIIQWLHRHSLWLLNSPANSNWVNKWMNVDQWMKKLRF